MLNVATRTLPLAGGGILKVEMESASENPIAQEFVRKKTAIKLE